MNNESLYYNVRVKGHLEDNWTELYTYNSPDLVTLKGTIPIQSNSQYTVLSYSAIGYLKNTQVDFQAEAIYGAYSTQEPASHDPFAPSQTAFRILADGESGWSGTQTIIIGETSSSSPTPTPVNSASNSSLLLIATIALVVIAFLLAIIILLLLYIRKRRITFSPTKTTPNPLESAKPK